MNKRKGNLLLLLGLLLIMGTFGACDTASISTARIVIQIIAGLALVGAGIEQITI